MNIKSNFVGSIVDFPYNEILYISLKNFFNSIKLKYESNTISDWSIIFQIHPTNLGWLNKEDENIIGIYKKGITYVESKEKIFTISIPVPNDIQVSWGIPKKNFLYRPINENNKSFLLVEQNYNNFDNLNDYIIDSVIKSVNSFLKKGFNLKKIKVYI